MTADHAPIPGPWDGLDPDEVPEPPVDPHDPDLAVEQQLDAAALFARDVDAQAHRMRVRDAARRKLVAEQQADAPPMDFGLLKNVLERPTEPPHRVDGLMPSDGGTLIIAQRKTGKTTITLNLARSLITGEPFLGRFAVRPISGTVAFLNFEVSAAQLARWAADVDVPPELLLLVNLRGRRNPLASEADRDLLAKLLREHDVTSLIVDPFGRAFTGQNQNDAGEVGAWLADLDRLARGDAGVQDLILTAHAGWNGERTRGSSALEDWADSIVNLTRGEGDDKDRRYFAATGRDVDIEEDELTFNPTTRAITFAGTGSRRASQQARQLSELVHHVVDFVAANPDCSKHAIEKGVNGRASVIRQATAEAVARGLIWQETTGNRISHRTPTRPDSSQVVPDDPDELVPSSLKDEGRGTSKDQPPPPLPRTSNTRRTHDHAGPDPAPDGDHRPNPRTIREEKV